MAEVIAPRPKPASTGRPPNRQPELPESKLQSQHVNGITGSDDRDRKSAAQKANTKTRASQERVTPFKMRPASPPAQDDPAAQSPIDPISRQILERTKSSGPQQLPRTSTSYAPGPTDERDPTRARGSSEAVSLRRVDSSASAKLTKEKKKGVSFLSRIMGGKKRDESDDGKDAVSEISEQRSAGNEAELFSAPVGFIPRFPGPPKYIKVKAHNRRRRDFDRLFLAQILLDTPRSSSRKVSIDSKIHSIDDAPAVQPTPGARSANRAVWAMEFSKDGRFLAAAGQDKKLRVWEVVSNPEDREVDDRDSAHGEDMENVKLNAPVFKEKLIREYDGHTSSILDLSWSKNNFLLSSSMDKTVRLYHISRAECLCAFKHNDFVTSIQFHPRDDRFFLAGSLDSKIRLWSIPDKSVAFWQQVPDMVTAVAFTPDGKTAIAGTLGGLCILYDTEGLKAHSQIHVKSARGKNSKGSKVTGIDTIAIPRDNGHSDVKILITSNDSRIRMYNLKDRNLEIKFRGNENSCSQIHATFSDDGRFVICGSEDRKVYIWPTGPYERTDSDKRPVEVFEAHSTIVTSAILVPTTTRRLLAQSGDPIYDLCNPPPVTLLSRADSVLSSRAPTHHSGHSADEKRTSAALSRKSDSPKRAPESPAYLARHSHTSGYMVVTADYSGQIKIFRQDCAYQKRRQESWDDSSTFSKKMLGRSGSVMTRNSVASSVQRHSVAYGAGPNLSKTGSSERILNWRNSISLSGGERIGTGATNSATASEVNIRQSLGGGEVDRARSVSPGTSTTDRWKKRFSLRRETPLKDDSSSPTGHGKRMSTTMAPPAIEITPQTPLTPDSPGTFHSATGERANSNSLPAGVGADGGEQLQPEQQEHAMSNPNDPLYLVEGQSMMAWDVSRTIIPMAQQHPRTPGLLGPDGNPLSRANSYVSELSSEVMSSEGDLERERELKRRDSVGSADAGAEDGSEDLKCGKCGGKSFRASVGVAPGEGQRLRCKRCGTAV